MKAKILISVLFILITFSCEKNKDESIYGKITSYSDCKDDKDTFTNDNSMVKYSYNQENKTLSLEHINTSFNCCPDTLSCDISIENNTITIEESEKESACDCMCLYDTKTEVYNIEVAKYTVKYIEPYIGNQTEIIFEIDLANETSGSYSVERTKYPWGI